jgi:hypothetical protein
VIGRVQVDFMKFREFNHDGIYATVPLEGKARASPTAGHFHKEMSWAKAEAVRVAEVKAAVVESQAAVVAESLTAAEGAVVTRTIPANRGVPPAPVVGIYLKVSDR